MSEIRNCNIPEDLYYLVEKHVWLSFDGELVTMGMTDVAQSLAGNFLSVTAKKVGKVVKRGRSVATVESSKWVGPIPCPVQGEVVEINDEVISRPGTMNEDPYGAWVVKLRPEDWETDSAELVTGSEGVSAYEAFLEAEGIECGSD